MLKVTDFLDDPASDRAFLALPQRLYGHDPKWIPDFDDEMREWISSRHLLSSYISQRHFLVWRGDRVVGRATAFINQKVSPHPDPPPQGGRAFLGTIGHFACEDDPEAAKALLDAACEWLKGQGITSVWGPMNGTMWRSYRFMTGGFEQVPFYGEPYNPAYEPALFEAAGFQIFKRWSSLISAGENLVKMMGKTQTKYELINQSGYRFRNLDLKNFDGELDLFHQLISDSFSGFAGFHPMDLTTFKVLYRGLKDVCDPKLVFFAYDPDGEVAGYAVSLPDYGRALRAMRGKTNLTAKLRFLWNKRNPTAHVALYMGISAKERQSRTGLGAAIAHRVIAEAHKANLPLVSALMSEESHAGSYARDFHDAIRTYALYERSL